MRVEIERAGAFRAATVVRLDAGGKGLATLHVLRARTAIRVLYAGSEAFAPGVSAVRTVPRAPANA